MGLIKTKYLYAVEEISVHELENTTVQSIHPCIHFFPHRHDYHRLGFFSLLKEVNTIS
jgi:hypothetical protein